MGLKRHGRRPSEIRNLWEAKVARKDRVLDIGSWDGKRISSMKDKCSIWGMDIDREKVKEAPKEIRKRIKIGDVTQKIPYEKKFDWIFLGEVLEHIKEDDKALKNISNSLKKGGYLILSTPKSVKFFEVWDPAWIKWKLGGPIHRHYTKKELFGKLEEAGFVVEDYFVQYCIDFIPKRIMNIILKYVLKVKKRIKSKDKEGYFDWNVLAKKK